MAKEWFFRNFVKKSSMPSQTIFVKSISSLSEARYCAGMLVDYISFDFSPKSKKFTDKSKFEEIKGWLSGVKIIGSYESSDIFSIIECINTNDLTGFLFNQDQIQFADELDLKTKILELNIASVDEYPANYYDKFEAIVLTGGVFDTQLKKMKSKYDGLLLIGYDFENVKNDFSEINGFAFLGSMEERPGFNNYDQLMDCLEYLEEKV